MVALNFRGLALLCVVGPSAALHSQPRIALEAPLTEAGYQKVASLKSDGDMKTFIKRILAKLGLDVADEGQLSGFSSYYSGTQAVQHYETLQNELRVASWVQEKSAETRESASKAPPEPAVKALPEPAVKARATRAKTHAKEAVSAAPMAAAAAPRKRAVAATMAAPTTTTTTTTAAAVEASTTPARTPAAVEPRQAKEARANRSPAQNPERANFLGFGVNTNNTVAAEAHSLPAVDMGSEANQNLLPAVNEVMSTASKTLKVFAANADQMRKKADEMKEASKRNLTLLKAHYETKLNSFKAENEELTKKNALLRSNISLVNATNDALEKHATNLQKSIDILHETFSELFRRVEVAEGFVGDSLNSTSVDDAPEVQVLAPTTPKPTLEAYLLDARRGLGLEASGSPIAPPAEELDDSVALLQVAAGSVASFEVDENVAVPKDPAQMTSFLLRTLEKLGAAEVTATHHLKSHFMSAKARWAERNDALYAEESHLKSQLKAVTQRQEDLEAVRTALGDNNDLLKRKLVEFVEFLSFLDKAAGNAVSMASGASQAN